MMEKWCLLIAIMLMLALSCDSICMADAENGTAYDAICEEEKVEIDDAIRRMEANGNTEFLQMLNELKACEGLYIQDKTENSSEKTYTAEVDVYLKYGVPFCQVTYKNFRGELGEAEISYDTNGKYLFLTKPIGTFIGSEYEFSILISEDRMNIQWGTGNNYSLTRSEGAESELENPVIPFEETENYRLIMDKIDSVFSEYDHDCVYNAETHELFIYVAMKNNFRSKLLNGMVTTKNWESFLSQLEDVTSTLSTVVELSTREGLYSLHEGKCSITVVNNLNITNTYTKSGISCIVRNGVVVYDALNDADQ